MPECFEKCPDVCKPLGSVVTKYLAKEDPWSVVCSDEKAFTCPFQTNACKSLLATASAMDLPVPRSLAELEEKCPAKDKEKCPVGSMLLMPECFEKCPDACKPLGSVVTKYLAKEDPWSVVCSDEKAFTCPFHTDACKSLLATASAMNLPVPQSLAELEEKCPAKDKIKAKKSGKKVPAS